MVGMVQFQLLDCGVGNKIESGANVSQMPIKVSLDN